jgi:Flp pilus assembly protein TadD
MTTAAEYLTLGQQRHRAKDFGAATELYMRAVDADPANAEALMLLGLVCHQESRMGEAEGWYRRALALRPGDADLHFKLAMALMSQEKAEEAAQQLRETVRLRPDAAEAWNNLGGVLHLQGKTEESIQCYREALRLRPDYAEVCLNLGSALRENEQTEVGLHWYREAVRLQPDRPKALNNLATALLETGAVVEAEAYLRRSLSITPNSAQVLYALMANGLYTETDPDAEQLRTLLDNPNLPMLEGSFLHTTLANLLDREGRFDEAFPHFREANRLRREDARKMSGTFDAAEHARIVDRIIAAFAPAFFENARGFGSESQVPVFIVGMPRSGSSLVEQILTYHPEAAGVGELRDLPRLADKLPERLGTPERYPECVHALDAASVWSMAEAYLNRVRDLAGVHRRVTDKLLENFLQLGLIAVLFPRAHVIHCRRDPLDTCISCFCQVFRTMNFTWDLEDFAVYYQNYERLMAYWQSVLPMPVHEIIYEKLVAEPERECRRLIEFCGLDWNERCLRFHENPRSVRTVSKLQVRRPIYDSSIGRWQRYAKHLAPVRKALGLCD